MSGNDIWSFQCFVDAGMRLNSLDQPSEVSGQAGKDHAWRVHQPEGSACHIGKARRQHVGCGYLVFVVSHMCTIHSHSYYTHTHVHVHTDHACQTHS